MTLDKIDMHAFQDEDFREVRKAFHSKMNEVEEAKIAQKKNQHGGHYTRARRGAATEAQKLFKEQQRNKLFFNEENREAKKEEQKEKAKLIKLPNVYEHQFFDNF